MFAALDPTLTVALILAAFFLGDIALLVFILYRHRNRKPTELIPEKSVVASTPWWAWPLVALFVVGWWSITLSADFMVLRSAMHHYRSHGYDSTEGMVLKCAMTESSDSEGTTYSVDIIYEYEVDGQEFRGVRVRYYSLWDRAWVVNFVSQHPPQSVVTVYYDPVNPTEAVLLRETDGGLPWLALFLVPFNAVMVGIFAFAPYCLRNGGIQPRRLVVRETESTTRIDLAPMKPIVAGVGAFVIMAFLAAFCLAFCFSMPPSLPSALIAWIIVFAGSAIFYRRVATRIAAGKFDLVIDRAERTLTLPEIVAGTGGKVIRLSEIIAVDVVPLTDSEGGQIYVPTVRWCGNDGIALETKLSDSTDKEWAESLAIWVRDNVGLAADFRVLQKEK